MDHDEAPVHDVIMPIPETPKRGRKRTYSEMMNGY